VKLRKLEVRGFKSLAELRISFDDALTVVVGENDAGKTSLIECLKVITQGRPVGTDDFTHGANAIDISVEIDDFLFLKGYRKNGAIIEEEPMRARPTHAYIERTLARIQSEEFDLTSEENQVFVKDTARLFGLTVRSNSVVANLRAAT
jgi:putative ATP-dependent endonuclease of the OLD family